MASLVLVTGSSGRIGQAVVAELLRRGVAVRGFDRTATLNLADMVVGDLTDAAAIQRAMTGVTTLIHLAATPDDADFLTELLPNNVVGVYHVLEAARAAGVRRLILASSGQVVWHTRLRGPFPLPMNAPIAPRHWYAALKVFLEAAGCAFAETFGMEVLAVRLGWCPRTRAQVEEIRGLDWAQDVYLSPPDAGRFFADAAQTTTPFQYAMVYATSKPVQVQRYDLEETRRVTGFSPRHQWPEGIEVVTG